MIFKRIVQPFIACLLMMSFSCTNTKDGGQEDSAKQAAPSQQDIVVVGQITYIGGLQVLVSDEKTNARLGGGNLVGDSLRVVAKGLRPNIVYYLTLKGANDDMQQQIPFFLAEGQDTVEVEWAKDSPTINRRFSVVAQHKDQELLNAYVREVGKKEEELANQVVQGGNVMVGKMEKAKTIQQLIPEIKKDLVLKGEPLVSTLYLMLQLDDLRANAKQYEEIYQTTPEAVKQSIYGKDLAARFEIISKPPTSISFKEELQAKDKERKAFGPDDFPRADRFVLYFWASWDRTTKAHISRLQSMSKLNDDDKAQWIFLSMDARYSDWDKTNLGLPYNYMLDAGSQQTLVKNWYMTELPFLIVTDKGGKVLRASSSLDEIGNYLSQ
ncbi:thioredoxin family protein [Olivibacter sitiensis]|uniref:thioredoxin family protein n=1 Tax=Olivibacter sitiensis TaxID=376470 RepID=UPI0004218C20|nr:thioredoxin family protein [Olivibacter sitiensis]